MKYFKLMCATLILIAPCFTYAGIIDFEDLSDGDIVTNQYAGVTFSSNAGFDNLITTQPGSGFGNNFICTGPSGGSIDCAEETILTFSDLVDDLTFWQVGDNDVGVVALVDVFVNGLFAATVDILGFTTPFTPELVDLSAFNNISSIRIYNITDFAGLGWDNFEFTPVGSAAVSEPATLALLGLGIVGLGLARRKLGTVTLSTTL